MSSYKVKPLNEAFEDFLRVKKIKDGLKERTLQDHKTHFNYFQRYLVQTGKKVKFVHEINEDTCLGYWEFMQEKVKWDDHIHISKKLKQKVTGLSRSTIKIRTRTLKAQFNYYREKGYITDNPWQGFNLKNNDGVPRYFSQDELLRLFNSIDVNTFEGERDRTLYHFLLDTGCRIGGCLKLNEWDFDLENHKVHFSKDITKNVLSRTCPLSKDTVTMLKRLFQKNALIEQRAYGGVFLARNGSRLTYAGVSDTFKRRAKKANIENAHLHRFRHSFAVHFILNGGDLASLKALGGWKTLEALQIYQKIKEQEATIQHKKYSPTNNLIK